MINSSDFKDMCSLLPLYRDYKSILTCTRETWWRYLRPPHEPISFDPKFFIEVSVHCEICTFYLVLGKSVLVINLRGSDSLSNDTSFHIPFEDINNIISFYAYILPHLPKFVVNRIISNQIRYL